MRLRFAPSPTGPLHIGGLRTALYNYLLAKKHGGHFVLRIEDTDQNRYVPGAEDYIIRSLRWAGLIPDEGPGFGGDFGPYRQSERKSIYQKYAKQLVESGHAYYAFDTPEELDAWREKMREQGIHSPKYDASTRMSMRNSLTMTEEKVEKLLENNTPYTIRIKVPESGEVAFRDLIRGEVSFQCDELDDKVMLKTDGLPTYHLANIVDDHLMEITHVVRGEEWLSSTAHHVLLYRAFDWEKEMPVFAHLPLILKPQGSGKLSKRDGTKLGIPVFPLSWKAEKEEDSFVGFREFGFLPDATVNFLALLGWNPGTEQEIFSLDQLIEAFSIDHIGKSGARFDIDKAKWFNQQYIIHREPADLLVKVREVVEAHGQSGQSDEFLLRFIELMQERVMLLTDFWSEGQYFFTRPTEYAMKMVRKRWKAENRPHFDRLLEILDETNFEDEPLEAAIKGFINDHGLKFGEVLPMLRIAMTGSMTGPDLFAMMALLGSGETKARLVQAFQAFDAETGV